MYLCVLQRFDLLGDALAELRERRAADMVDLDKLRQSIQNGLQTLEKAEQALVPEVVSELEHHLRVAARELGLQIKPKKHR